MKWYSNKKKSGKGEEVHEPLLSSSNNTKVHKLFETSCGKRYLINELPQMQVKCEDNRSKKIMKEENFL